MLGKILLTIDALALIFATPFADYNHTHIFNPRWPPHAKFHCGQTITLSIILGLATLFYTWRTSFPSGRIVGRESLRTAAFTGSIYWLAGLAAIMYPGTDGVDPEFGPSGFPQAKIFALFMGLGILGWGVETLG